MIYKFVEVIDNNISYTLNFMRYTCNNEGVVGCTMREIQFHKAHLAGSKNKGYINMDINNNFAICYTETDKDETNNVEIEKYINSNGINVCYNPPVEWPNKQPFDLNATTYIFEENLIKEIIEWFIYFIEKEGKKEEMTLDKYNVWKTKQGKK